MKKIILFGFIAAAALAGCSKDETVKALPQENAIEFGTYLGRDAMTKGVELTNANLLNFGVFASYTGQNEWTAGTGYYNFMYDQYVSRESNTADWTYNPKKYWPTTKDDKISFFAYAPHQKDPTTGIAVKKAKDDAGAPVITYSIDAANLTTQADFTADVLMNQVKAGDESSIDSEPRTVSFELLHELTRLNFTACLDREAFGSDDANKTKVNIKSINFVEGGEFYTSADYTFATENDERGTWSNQTTADLNIAGLLNTATPESDDLGGYVEPGILLADTDPVTLFKKTGETANYLFLIPTDEDGLATDGEVQIEVAYDIVTVDAALNAGHSCTPATKIIDFPAGTLKQGVAYSFNLKFGLNEIKLSASVVDWATGTIDENVDWPKDDAE